MLGDTLHRLYFFVTRRCLTTYACVCCGCRRDGGAVAGGGGAEALRAAAERGVQGRVHVGQQLRAGVPSGGLGRRQLRRTQAPVQVQQAVLA
jgi:hypothetical protein